MKLYNTNELLLNYLKTHPLLLAPMAGVTDYPFRSFMREMNAGILTTELVSAIALVRGETQRTKQLAQINSHQQPIGVQIFGEDPETLAEAALIVEKQGASFVDLNLGCPVSKIVKKGAGSAVLKDLKLLSSILRTIRKKIKIPLTIKVRTGWNQNDRNSLEVSKIATDEGCLWMTIHGRTREQAYAGEADWNYIKDIKSKAPLPIIGNGDLVQPQQIKKIFLESKCDGLMIGRGALRNPWIFNESFYLLNQEPLKKREYSESLQKLWKLLHSFYEGKIALIQFKKFVTWFSVGYPESTQFRKRIFQLKEKELVMNEALDYFQKFCDHQKENPEYEAFLRQGHG